jgi:hypothetical protein
MAAYFNTLKLPEYLVDKTVMFSDFLGSIFGAVSSQPYELGKTLYERIANTKFYKKTRNKLFRVKCI